MTETTAVEFVKQCADVASSVAWAAGVGAVELAGQFVSVLAAHPEHIDRFMREGAELCIDGTLGMENGCLTYMAVSGKITFPDTLRADLAKRENGTPTASTMQ